jgi:hypothetical protein
MAALNDHILQEGVENLESESGRARFFKNLKKAGIDCSEEKMQVTLKKMKPKTQMQTQR